MARPVLSSKEFLQECFPARLAAMCTDDALEVCRKNGMDFVDILQPFCRPSAELIVSDLSNHRFYLRNFFLHITTLDQSLPPNPNITRNILHERVAKAVDNFSSSDSQRSSIVLKDRKLDIPNSVPWFDAFREEFIRSFPFNDNEYIRDYLGCVFVVSTSISDPVARVKSLMEQQVQHQANHKYPRWFGPNIFKYFVILDDCSAPDPVDRSNRGESALQYFRSTYGDACCTLLKVNSAQPTTAADSPVDHPWSSLLSLKRDNSFRTQKNSVSNGAVHSGSDTTNPLLMDHPLADGFAQDSAPLRSGSFDVKPSFLLLDQGDADRIRSMIVSLISKALIPHIERLIKSINETIISKKGIHRTLMNATKKIFGPTGPPKAIGKPSSGSNPNQVVYLGGAVELQSRKAGDLSFIFQMCDQAFQFFDSARRDFRNDQAWIYYAAASELCALSVFLSTTANFNSGNSKAFPLHYMEDAIKSISENGRLTMQSVRPTLFATEICKALGLYSEAAVFYKGRFVDDFDLLHGVFMEQAGYCYLKLQQPSAGRFAHHMISSGHRYFKAAQRKLGIYVYGLALEVMEGKGWLITEDHIKLNIIRHSIALKMFQQAFSYCLTALSDRLSPQQQLLVLRDAILCSQVTDGVRVLDWALPVIKPQEIRTVLGKSVEVDSQWVEVADETWSDMEDTMARAKKHAHPLFRHQQYVFGSSTDNRHHPVISVSEVLSIELPMENALGITLNLSDFRLEYSFVPREDSVSQPLDISTTFDPQQLILEPKSRSALRCSVQAAQCGSLEISGIEYTVRTPLQLEDGSVTELSTRVRQKLKTRGWRLNGTKAEKSGAVYAPDRRLEITVIPPSGKLIARWENFPKSVLSGQIVRLTLSLENQGSRAVDHVSLSSSVADCLMFFNGKREGDLWELTLPDGKIDPGQRVALQAIFVAPMCPARITCRVLVYSESIPLQEDRDHKHKYRLWRIQQELDVLPSLSCRGVRKPISGRTEDYLISLYLEHVNSFHLANVPFKIIEILGVGNTWGLRNLSGEIVGDGAFNPGEEMQISLLAGKIQLDSNLRDGFLVTNELDAADQTFVRAAKSLTDLFLHHCQEPHNLVLRLLWKVVLIADGKPMNIFGIRLVKFHREDETTPDISKVLNPDPADRFLLASEDELMQIPSKEKVTSSDTVVEWLVELCETNVENARRTHSGVNVKNFTLRLLCSENHISTSAVEVQVEFRTAARCFPTGSRRLMCSLSPGEKYSFDFSYCFLCPGTFNMAEFVSVRALSVQQRPICAQMLLTV